MYNDVWGCAEILPLIVRFLSYANFTNYAFGSFLSRAWKMQAEVAVGLVSPKYRKKCINVST